MRILIVDDHSLLRDGIAGILEAAGHEVIGQACDGLQAIEETKRLHPDLVLMDISMPRMDGLEALRHISAECPDVRVVMLTVSDDDETLLASIKAGAKGYLLKDLTTDGFLKTLEGLERGDYAMSPQSAFRLIEGLLDAPRQETEPQASLTDREIEVLQLAAEGLSNRAIANQLSVSENTVKYYIKKILQKLGVQNRTEAVARAIRLNLIQEKTDAD